VWMCMVRLEAQGIEIMHSFARLRNPFDFNLVM
jgi:hypothetical protein